MLIRTTKEGSQAPGERVYLDISSIKDKSYDLKDSYISFQYYINQESRDVSLPVAVWMVLLVKLELLLQKIKFKAN